MIEYVNSFLSSTLLGINYYIYYKYKIFLRVPYTRSIKQPKKDSDSEVMDSVILDQLNNLKKTVILKLK